MNIDKLVLELCKGFEHTCRHLFTDNFYTSVTLCKALKDLGIKATGTIRKNRKFLPKDFGNEKLDKGKMKFYEKGALMAVSWQDKKRICVISTNGSNRINNVGKPEIVDIYINMGGVDLFD